MPERAGGLAMRCMSCGTTVPDGLVVCTNCGKTISSLDSLLRTPALPDLSPGLPGLSPSLPDLSGSFSDFTVGVDDLAAAREGLAFLIAARGRQLQQEARIAARRHSPAPSRPSSPAPAGPAASTGSSNRGMVGCVVALVVIVVVVLLASQVLLGAIHLGG
jgi:hypothetical protein